MSFSGKSVPLYTCAPVIIPPKHRKLPNTGVVPFSDSFDYQPKNTHRVYFTVTVTDAFLAYCEQRFFLSTLVSNTKYCQAKFAFTLIVFAVDSIQAVPHVHAIKMWLRFRLFLSVQLLNVKTNLFLNARTVEAVLITEFRRLHGEQW